MRCPKCHRRNPDTYLYCAHCGHRLTPTDSEIRFATVLFFDLSGYTRFAHEKGVEAAWQETQKIFPPAEEIIKREGGKIYAVYGDGLLAVFGLPPSRETEAEKALRAAQRVVEESERLFRAGETRLRGRAVVTSGLILISKNLVGDPFNRASRMIAGTPPGVVELDETTLGLVPGIRARPLPPRKVRGYAEPIHAFRLEGFYAREPRTATGKALKRLEAAWERARRGQGQVAVLVGPPGSGKGLLLSAFLEGKDPAEVVRLPPLPPGASLRGWIRAFFEEHPGLKAQLEGLPLAPPERKRLEVALGFRTGRVPEHAALEAVVQAIPRLAERPKIVVLEGLHRAPQLLRRFLDAWQEGSGPVLILGTARSGDYPGAIRLGKLPPEEAVAWLEKRAPGVPLLVRRQVAELADGLPGLMLKLLPAPREDRLVALMQPRFDELGEAREALLIAAQLPEPVDPEGVETILGPGARAALAQLVAEGFLAEGEDGLVFQSPAYRRAAAALVPETRRKAWMKALAEARLDQGRPEEAARFYAEADLPGAAIRVLRVLARSKEDAEAIRLLTQAAGLARTAEQAQPVRIELAERRVAADPEGALATLRGINHPQADRLRAEAWLRLGDREDAARALARYLRVRPQDGEAWARFLAVAPPELLLQIAPPEDPALAARLARRMEEAGFLGPAEALYQTALQRAEGDLAAEIAIALAGIAWRSFRPREAKAWAQSAREAAQDPATKTLAEAFFGALSLDTGEIEAARRHIGAAAGRLADLACNEAFVRVAGIELRFLLETGAFAAAEEKARRYFEACPHPWIGALYALTLALLGRAEAARARAERLLPEADSPHTEGMLYFTLGLVRAAKGEDPRPFYRLALRKANVAQNPYLKFLVLAALALFYRKSDPRRTKAIADRILRQTWRQGYLPFLQLARLLKAEGARASGRRVAPLLRFESPFAVLEYWRRSLLKAEGQDVEPVPEEAVLGYGILGRLALANWKRVWTHGKKSAPESA